MGPLEGVLLGAWEDAITRWLFPTLRKDLLTWGRGSSGLELHFLQGQGNGKEGASTGQVV